MLAALLAGSMLLTACGGTGGQTASQAPKGEASQSAPADTGTQSGQKVTMKVSVGVADNHFEAVAVNKMKEYIEEQTGGNFTVEIFTGAQIGNDQEVFEGLKLGVADTQGAYPVQTWHLPPEKENRQGYFRHRHVSLPDEQLRLPRRNPHQPRTWTIRG